MTSAKIWTREDRELVARVREVRRKLCVGEGAWVLPRVSRTAPRGSHDAAIAALLDKLGGVE